jgi:hypothetical protein
MILIGYSGHAFVVYGILHAAGKKVTGYCDVVEKNYNPFNLPYYGTEDSEAALDAIRQGGYFSPNCGRTSAMITMNSVTHASTPSAFPWTATRPTQAWTEGVH